jgi:hypothetical protein
MKTSTVDIDSSNNFAITIDGSSPSEVSFGQINDTYFFDKLNLQLSNIHNNDTNTPLFLSQNNSDDENSHPSIQSPRSDYQLHNEFDEYPSHKKLSFEEVEKSIEKYYDCETKYSNEFDLLITYLNGQKHLFIQSQKITQTKLNVLIVPSLIMSATITLFLPLSSDRHYWFTPILVSILNATITLFISLVNYCKLESTQELFGYFANQYEKLQTDLEFKNNRLLFIENKNQKKYISKEIQKLEKKMNEIKNSSTILVPAELNKLFPIIYHINIFSVIKKIENYRSELIHKLRDVKNEIRFILFKKDKLQENEKRRIQLLIETKEKIRKQIVSYKNSYYDIDSLFNKEIKFAESHTIFILSSCCIGVDSSVSISDDESNEILTNIIGKY